MQYVINEYVILGLGIFYGVLVLVSVIWTIFDLVKGGR